MDWTREAPRFRALALAQLAKVGLNDVRVADRARADDHAGRLGSGLSRFIVGATFNLAHSLSQMLHLRPRNRFEDLESVYLVGGGTHPGSGLPVIYESARITSRLLGEDLGMPVPVDAANASRRTDRPRPQNTAREKQLDRSLVNGDAKWRRGERERGTMGKTRSGRIGVIGGGLGGLAAACTLAARGYDVVLFEKNPWLGGKAAVLSEGGFRFDMGPTILLMPSVLRANLRRGGPRPEG